MNGTSDRPMLAKSQVCQHFSGFCGTIWLCTWLELKVHTDNCFQCDILLIFLSCKVTPMHEFSVMPIILCLHGGTYGKRKPDMAIVANVLETLFQNGYFYSHTS